MATNIIDAFAMSLLFGVHQYTTTLCASIGLITLFVPGEFGDLFWSGRTLSW